MKILFIGVFDPTSTNVSQVEAFRRLGCEVYAYDYRNPPSGARGHLVCNEVVALYRSYKPDIVLFSKCRDWPSWVAAQCNDAVRVLWYMDCPPPNGNYTHQLVDLMRQCELVYCNIWGSVEVSRNRGILQAELLQEGFDPLVDKPVDVPFEYDVTFIGGLRNRRYVYHQMFKFKVISGAYREEHAKAVCQSRINLNFTEGGASDRVYKILAAGGFLLTEPWPKMEDDFTPKEDFDIFESPMELERKMEYYLLNENKRLSIAEQGNQTVQKFSRDNWAKRILEDAKEKM